MQSLFQSVLYCLKLAVGLKEDKTPNLHTVRDQKPCLHSQLRLEQGE